jgi:hypothetical protein
LGRKKCIKTVGKYPYSIYFWLQIDRRLNIILLYGILKGFYKHFISCEVIALAIATLNQDIFGYNKGIKTEISGYIIIISRILDIDYKLLLIVA